MHTHIVYIVYVWFDAVLINIVKIIRLKRIEGDESELDNAEDPGVCGCLLPT